MQRESSSSVRVFFPPWSLDGLIERLKAYLPALRDVIPVRRAVLFGSWADGKATAFSDVDVLITYGGPPRKDAYETVRGVLRLRGLEPHVYSQKEAEELKVTLDRMTRNGIVLFP